MAQSDVTQLLINLTDGDQSAVNELLPRVYDELRALAQHHLSQERADHTLQATALVHEVYLKLVDQDRVQWQNRAHFVAVAAQAIRRILVDHARSQKRLKRGGDRAKLSLDGVLTLAAFEQQTDLIELDTALERLTAQHPEKSRVVELRFFGGLTADEVASLVGVTTRTVERHWQFARAWLYRELHEDADE